MGFIDWLFYSIQVTRRLTNSYYLIMAIITMIAVILLIRMRFKRFSFNLWLISGLICLFWELYLYSTGARHYNFAPALELSYHALTEAGPGLIIMILFAHKIKLIDISEYSDDYWTKMLAPGNGKTGNQKKLKHQALKSEPKHRKSDSNVPPEPTIKKSSTDETGLDDYDLDDLTNEE